MGGGGEDEMAVDGGGSEDTEEDVVPTVFRWEHGGRQVYIQGTFNNWERQIPMHRSGNDFTYIHNLKRGKHAFKFIVDDEWRWVGGWVWVCDVCVRAARDTRFPPAGPGGWLASRLLGRPSTDLLASFPIYPSIRGSVRPPIRLSVYPSTPPSPSIHLPIHPSAYPSLPTPIPPPPASPPTS